MSSLSGDHQGYYYSTEKDTKDMAEYYGRSVEKFEVDADYDKYAAI